MRVHYISLGLAAGDSFSAMGSIYESWKVWPIVKVVNFKYISKKHRLTFMHGAQIALNRFLPLLVSLLLMASNLTSIHVHIRFSRIACCDNHFTYRFLVNLFAN